MFSFVSTVKDGSLLPFFQYLVSLALVQTVREFDPNSLSLSKVPVNIKWPNDIYSNQHKLAGILCNSEYHKGEFKVITGVGLNVSNSLPSTCINDILKEEKWAANGPRQHRF